MQSKLSYSFVAKRFLQAILTSAYILLLPNQRAYSDSIKDAIDRAKVKMQASNSNSMSGGNPPSIRMNGYSARVLGLAQSLGINPGTSEWRRVEVRVKNYGNAELRNLVSTKPIILHLKANEGKAIADANVTDQTNQLQEPFNSSTLVNDHFSEKLDTINTKSEMFEKEMNELFTPPELPNCEKNNIVRKAVKSKSIRSSNEQVLFDNLFVSPDYLTEILNDFDSREMFGIKTMVTRYSTQLGNFASVKAVEYGASCLPFRIRVTRDGTFYLSGDVALKNFDSKQDGEYHSLIKEHLNEAH